MLSRLASPISGRSVLANALTTLPLKNIKLAPLRCHTFFVARSPFLPKVKRQVWAPAGALTLNDLDGVVSVPDSPHWRALERNKIGEADVRLPHPIYTREELENVEITHLPATSLSDRIAYGSIWTLRRLFDVVSGYAFGLRSEKCMIRRIVILETVAAIPGMVGAFYRHLRSLRKMKPDYGWIHTLLEEAENERMHLMTALALDNPSLFVRGLVHVAQFGFVLAYGLLYAISPSFCHRFVGYLEEEAVKTYTKMSDLIDNGKLPGFKVAAPAASRAYWGLADDATIKEVILAMRADEAHHRQVNHVLAELHPDSLNPFPPGS